MNRCRARSAAGAFFLAFVIIATAGAALAEEDSPGSVIALYSSLPDKYRIPGLNPVDRVVSFNITGWSGVDKRSLIVRLEHSRRYLIVLDRDSSELPFAKTIVLDQAGSSIRPGFDKIYIVGGAARAPYNIQAIFEIANGEMARSVQGYIRDYDSKGDTWKGKDPTSRGPRVDDG